jgi:hypothetical protein
MRVQHSTFIASSLSRFWMLSQEVFSWRKFNTFDYRELMADDDFSYDWFEMTKFTTFAFEIYSYEK